MRYQIFSSGSCPIINISCIGYSFDAEVTRYGAQKRNCYIIHYVLAGKGYFKGEAVGKGEGFLITPESYGEYYPDENNPWSFLWIISEDEKFSEIFNYYNADEKTNIFSYSYIDEVQKLANELVKISNPIQSANNMLGRFLAVFAYQLKSIEYKDKKNNEEIYIEAAQKYIETNLSLPFSVNELTSFLGISQPYLFKIFKKRFNLSPKEYIIKKKIMYASELLESTELKISDVALSVGYSDALEFSKIFKKKVGVSPQKYKTERS